MRAATGQDSATIADADGSQLGMRQLAMAWLREHYLAALTLPILTIVLYAPTLGYDFVNWDDPWYVYKNPLVQGWSISNLFQIATGIVIRNYAPLTIFSYLLDHTFFGLWAGGYHLTNFSLHALNAVLAYVLVSRLTGSRFVGWTTAALFAVHPIHIESVAWIASRKGLLSASFILATLICWLRPHRTPRQEGYGLLFLAAALLSKIIAVCVPAIVLLYDVIVQRRPIAEALPRQVIPGFMALCLLMVNMSAQTSESGGVRGHLSLNKAEILAVDSVILWKYAGMLAYPRNLSVLYDPPTSGIGWAILLSLTGWLIVAWGVWRLGKRVPLVTFAALTSLVFLLPVLNLFPLTTLMNDRYLYLPSIPVFALAAGGLRFAFVNWPSLGPSSSGVLSRRRAVLACATVVLIIGAYGWAAQQRLPVWRNGMALWQDTVQRVPQLAVVQIQLANTLHQRGEDEQAIAVLEFALRECAPDRLDRKRILLKLQDWRGLSG